VSVLDRLVVANQILSNEGVVDAFGHISLRDEADPERFWLARAISPTEVTVDDLQVFWLDGSHASEDDRRAYSERFIHAAIYEARPEVASVCHNHAPATITWGVQDRPLRPVFHVPASIGSPVPVWDIAADFGATNMLVNDLPRGRSLARCLENGAAVLMRGHGAVTVGCDEREAVYNAVQLERNASIAQAAAAMGEVRFLSEGEVDAAGELALSDLSLDRSWGYWLARLSRAR
jgi:ribulose-5-phosphate 4-epimerase/fuculose-1-phosphate aldolase